MIQEIGRAYDNHYVACEAAGADYVLHYRERGCLVHVTSHGGADAWAEGNAFDLPRVRDLAERPSRLVYAFAIGGARFFLALDDEVAAPAVTGTAGTPVGAAPGVGLMPTRSPQPGIRLSSGSGGRLGAPPAAKAVAQLSSVAGADTPDGTTWAPFAFV